MIGRILIPTLALRDKIYTECKNRLRHSHCCVAHCPLGEEDCKSCQREIWTQMELNSGTQLNLWGMNGMTW